MHAHNKRFMRWQQLLFRVEDESETHCCKFFMQMSWKCMLWEPFMLCQLRVDAFLICEVPDFSFEMFCLR